MKDRPISPGKERTRRRAQRGGRLFFLAAILWSWSGAVAGEPLPGAPAVFEKHACGSCHRLSAAAPAGDRKAPDLFFAGDKFQPEWLRGFLRQPTVIRQAGYITSPGFLRGDPPPPHVRLSDEEARAAAGYLSSLHLPEPLAPLPDSQPLSKSGKAQIKIRFERQYGCISCHTTLNLAGKERGGISGPSLVAAGGRLRAEWVFNWLNGPEKFESKGRMPVFKLPPEEAAALARYVVTFKQEDKAE